MSVGTLPTGAVAWVGPLPETTTERLLAVADLVEADPSQWDQGQWSRGHGLPSEAQGEHACGTPGCIAGWGVRLTPVDVALSNDWVGAGQVALGLEADLAQAVFRGGYRPDDLPAVLRLIAGSPEGERTVSAALAAGLRDLRGADLQGADLQGAYLQGAYLRGAYLQGADLRDADLRDADLQGAYLGGAYLRDADLGGAYLRDAYLGGADLRDADLRDADLGGAYLRDADLRDADLQGAYLRGARRVVLPAGWEIDQETGVCRLAAEVA